MLIAEAAVATGATQKDDRRYKMYKRQEVDHQTTTVNCNRGV
jgi:hypothetical protein